MYAIYARQSIEKKDSVSIEVQVDFCKREIPDGMKVKIYTDKGYSGKNIDRPSFRKMFDDVETGLIEKIVTYKLDRISRSLLDFANLIEIFNKYNVEFISTAEKFDTSTPIGRAMLYIVMVFAQLERETIQQRVKDNYYERAKKGVYMGGAPPYGFDQEPIRLEGIKSRLLVANEYASYIKDMYEQYANTHNISLNQLVNFLNKKEIKTSNGKNWHSDKLSKLLRNPVYVKADIDVYNFFKTAGSIIQNDVTEFIGENGLLTYGQPKIGTSKWSNIGDYNVVIGPHEGIIDSKTWLKVQAKLTQNKSFKRGGKSNNTWISGLTKCMICGYSMHINPGSRVQNDGTMVMYLRCSERISSGVCPAKSIRLVPIENKVENELKKFIHNIDTKIKKDNNDSRDLNDIKIQISTKETEISNLLDGLASSSGSTINYIDRKINILDSELKILNKKMIEEITKNEEMDTEKIIKIEKLMLHWQELDIEDKKTIANAFIKKIYVSKEEIEIIWNY